MSYLKVCHTQLAVNSELEARARGAVSVEQHVRKLKYAKYVKKILCLW